MEEKKSSIQSIGDKVTGYLKENRSLSERVNELEEEKKIKNIQPKLMKINQQAQQEFVQLIQQEGFTPRRFQQIMRAVQMSAELLVDAILRLFGNNMNQRRL